jgi:lipopolysaccharide transport system ATP-binding protein
MSSEPGRAAASRMSTGPESIVCEGIGKRYRIGGPRTYRSLREEVIDLFRRPARDARDARDREHWALRDVTFAVPAGQALGLIGRNGAGKTTLLKILSRLTPPSTGRATVRGSVGTLLEVGAGFHPEFTGRENVYLSGAIHGMPRREIRSQLDSIVDFAGIGRYVDTPVKRYSSGMYMRLAFAVSAHLRSEILLVDEVLAVGDAEFQARVLGKMQDLAGAGRTVVFISHSMPAVTSLCERVIVLEGGRIACDGAPGDAVRYYLSEHDEALSYVPLPLAGAGTPRMLGAAVLSRGRPTAEVRMGDDITLAVDFTADDPIRDPRFGFVLYDAHRQPVVSANNRYQDAGRFEAAVRSGRIEVSLGSVPLMPGEYLISLYLGDMGGDTHVVEYGLPLRVREHDLWGLGQLPPPVSPLWWPTRFSYSSAEPCEAQAGPVISGRP